ncbi:T-cell immunoglobulin and mucin domain-containing protein 4 [Octodon degus]|uniref:T-cell immunoglobulin and mucin domain-containing protein 4 n=1 Tax=Octodon degus TaxID=10160 RepID=UPI000C9F210E|nr:T-cell immunoglobulin and mucin domain-containing protein 4 [Octodon degus]
MSKGAVVLWLAVVLEWLYLTPTRSQLTLTAFLGQSVTLPCVYWSWSPNSNSMCWGRGECPNSKCNQELIHTDGTTVTSRMSGRYRLQGNIQKGDVSLTILNTREGDSGVYCCRIEVPGWFNDVKNTIHLVLRRAPTTMRPTTTSNPTTTPHLLPTTTVLPTTGLTVETSNPTTTPYVDTTTAVLVTPLVTTATSHQEPTPRTPTTTAVLPTTFLTTRELTARTPLQTEVTSIFTTTATVCPLTRPSSAPETTPEPPMQGPTSTAESGTFLQSSDSLRSMEATSADSSLFTAKVSMEQEPQQEAETEAETKTDTNLLIIIGSGLGLTLLALLSAVLLQGKVTKASCLQKHKSFYNLAERQSVLNDTLHGPEEDDSLFVL